MSDLYMLTTQSSSLSKSEIFSSIVTLGAALTYNGYEQKQTVASVLLNGKTLIEGTDYIVVDNLQTNAGNYVLTIVGIGNYSGAKNVNYTIAKKTGSIEINPSSLSIIGGAGTINSVDIIKIGDGSLSVLSNDEDIVTASIINTTVSITGVASGNATLTITMADGVNYIGDSITINVNSVIISSTLSECTADQIQHAAQAGIGDSFWSVGDMTDTINFKNVTVGSLSFNNLSARAFILGFNHNSDIEGTGIHFQFGKETDGTDIAFIDSGYGYTLSQDVGNRFRMKSTSSETNDWNSSSMRTNKCLTFLTALPDEWQDSIAYCTKYTYDYNNNSVISTSDKIWLLSAYEVSAYIPHDSGNESDNQAQYDYYKNGNSKIKYKHTWASYAVEYRACEWWLRSYWNSTSGHIINVLGNCSTESSDVSCGFAPGFKIA